MDPEVFIVDTGGDLRSVKKSKTGRDHSSNLLGRKGKKQYKGSL